MAAPPVPRSLAGIAKKDQTGGLVSTAALPDRPNPRGRGRGRGGSTRGRAPVSTQRRTEEPEPELIVVKGQDLIPLADQLFGARHGKTFASAGLAQGSNFTNDTLAQMMPKQIADRVVKLIVQTVPLTPFYVIVANGDIGGVTLALLDNFNIRKTIAYVDNSQQREMLAKNVVAYGLESRFVAKPEPYNNAVDVQQGTILFMDATETSASLVKFFESCTKCMIIMALVPKGTLFKPKTKKSFEILDVPKTNYQMIVYINRKAIDEYKQILNIKTSLPATFTYVYEEPATAPGAQKTHAQLNEKWLKELRAFLAVLLRRFNPGMPKEDRDFILGDEMMVKYWAKTFTHDSYDPAFNYEELELLGDAAQGLAFIDYLINRFGNITKDMLTNAKARYMSNEFQSIYGRELGLSNYVRITADADRDDVQEDLFEAFGGALYRAANSIPAGKGGKMAYGLGLVYIYEFLRNFFEDKEFNRDYIMLGKAKTQFKEIHQDKLHNTPVNDKRLRIIRPMDDGVEVEIRMSNNDRATYAQYGFQVPEFLAKAKAENQKKAENLAFEQALAYFNRLGITREWADKTQDEITLNRPEFKEYYEAALSKAKKDGFAVLQFFEPKQGERNDGTKLVQLVGIIPDTYVWRKLDEIRAQNSNSGKIQLLKSYVQNK